MSQKIERFLISQKNDDIYEILEKEKKNKNFNKSEYICAAIRYYDANKGEQRSIELEEVQKIIDKKLFEFRREILNGGVTIDTKINENKILEENINKIPNTELEDD
ncbi:hypothetical protein [Clostridium felsineum]|uniref:hypothetical protein n=1 Tax=Clostridium felsineum TaxID=36839 RepID=UPI00098CE0B8|nr:hypothetical protein [Clostridium felsineum]URZ01255.1 hypothetical protein CLAUR_012440 [Clostridium felsineum]